MGCVFYVLFNGWYLIQTFCWYKDMLSNDNLALLSARTQHALINSKKIVGFIVLPDATKSYMVEL